MKLKLKLTILIIGLTSLCSYAQFGIGMRNTQYVYGDFTFKKHYEVSLEHSIFAEKPGFQYLRGYIGFKTSWRELQYKGQAYFGSTYNRSYYSTGVLAQARYTLFRHLIIDGKINPHYDSGLGYETCFYAGLGAVITPNIDILAGYNTIPEYRLSEHRAHLGLDFHVKHLSVAPTLSVATKGASRAKTLRVLVAFRYGF